ncbi:(2Fe-2S)-binding protein [Mesoterricola silvestris]|uniref:(2Fe-2S)-binding protein n=1 Tax=Mesoterricola silvestris TaxID=2927979 RepID=A0AA48H934_9BACT|nr:(2Fe-2S)-binding protein [Mesoterricola silvestris]BDU74043.1 (2Fe-2S)-binding protein [Mesoterricola silvestris]
MPDTILLTLQVNGARRTVETHPMARLLDVLREGLRLTGTKEGCGEGECGACTVLLNGRVVNSCLIPALQAQDAVVVTVEGLAGGEALSPIQDAFLTHNAAQCGFCTPGMLMAADDLLRRCPNPDREQVREGLAGNLCRCTGYSKILDAVQAVARQGEGK